MDGVEFHEEEHSLSLRQKCVYGLGHVFNDMVSTMWFSYLILYFSRIINLSATNAGWLILFGQIVDALVTPIFGIEADKTPFFSYGRRKVWHLAGTVMVMLSFPFLFTPCPFVPHSSSLSGDTVYFFYYFPFVLIFQTGWAIVQISHLALINDLGKNNKDRLALNSVRCAGTALASLASYSIMWTFLGVRHGNIDYHDLESFRNIAATITLCGIICSVIFHLLQQEYTGESLSTYSLDQQPRSTTMSWKSWIRIPEFYMIAVNYMLVRLAFNFTQVYISFYIVDTLELDQGYIAKIPLVNFVFSCSFSLFIGPLIPKRFHNILIFVNQFSIVLLSIWLKFIGSGLNEGIVPQTYFMYTLFGVVTTINLIISTTMVSNMISKRTTSDAFVFGIMSFCDKLLNGVVIFSIQKLVERVHEIDKLFPGFHVVGKFYRNIMFRLLLSVALIAIANHALYVYYVRSTDPEINIDQPLMVSESISFTN